MVSQLKWKRRIWLWVPAILVGLFVLVKALSVTQWIGSFTLTVNVQSDLHIESSDLRFATAMSKNEAQPYLSFQRWTDEEFALAEELKPLRLHITTVGSNGMFEDTYIYKTHLIIEYADPTTGQKFRELFLIPPGRGDRTMTVVLKADSGRSSSK